MRHHGGTANGVAWGYDFDVQTRVCFYAHRNPNTIATSFAIGAFLDAVEALGEDRWIDPAVAGCEYFVEHMLDTGGDGAFFRYVHAEPELIHNANLLAPRAVSRGGRLSGRADLVRAAEPAVATTVSAQRADGSWA